MADEDICVGDGTCVEICPGIFEMEENGAITKMAEEPEELEDRCREVAEASPMDSYYHKLRKQRGLIYRLRF